MVSDCCVTPPMPGKGGESPPPLPGKDDELLSSLIPGKGGGPPPPVSKGGGPPPPPLKFMNKKKATPTLKRSLVMGNLFRFLREYVEGSSQGEGSSRGRRMGGGSPSGSSDGQSMADALAELTRRSAYHQQIDKDVRDYDEPIKEIQTSLSSFRTKDMDVLLKFYQEVESKLDVLSDESQVLARFDGFPVKKLEALRMAAVLYKKLSKTLSELHNWKIESPLALLLDKVEKNFSKIKEEMEAIERTKDEEDKKFQSHGIHLDFNIILKIKEAMVNVSSSCIELALKEKREAKVETNDQTMSKARTRQKEVDINTLWRTFQFSYKVYTFAGGQDERAERLAKELATEIQADPRKD